MVHRQVDISRVAIPTISLRMTLPQQNEESMKMNVTAGCDEATAPNSIENSDTPKIWRKFMKNWPIISQPLSLGIIFLLLWAIGTAILPQYTYPNTVIMRLLFLFIGAQISGILVSFTGLPDMLGMLFWGVLYKNIGLGNFDGYNGLEATLRELALVNIMLLAGLGLDYDSLKKLFGMVMRLTLIPTIMEVGVISVLSFFLLDMPWLWGILLGLVVTAVSPNVVVTVVLDLKAKRLGMYKGIHTLILAMTSCNDVVAIFVFGVLLGVVFSQGDLTQQLLQGPIGIAIGLVFGFVFGTLLIYMPSEDSKYCNGLRFVMTTLAGIVSVIGSKAIGYPSAGALGCVMVSFVAGTGWRRKTGQEVSQTGVTLDLLWKFLKPISFSLIGKEVDFRVLDPKIVLYGFIVLLVAVLFRLAFSYVSAYGGDLNWKERAYVTIAGFPKATVQAALGPVALDLARKLNNSDDNIERSNIILVVSVLAIILTAPLGAVLLTKLAPRWLKKIPTNEPEVYIARL